MREAQSVVRSRLPSLPMIYILIVAMTFVYRGIIHNYADLMIPALNVLVILVLGAIAALLWSQRSLSMAQLGGLELGMIAMLAGKYAFSQCRGMLRYSLAGDPMSAWLNMKNIVIITAILILTYRDLRSEELASRRDRVGHAFDPAVRDLDAPLPATPRGDGMALARVDEPGRRPVELFSFDAMLLLILAVGSTYGAHMITNLRRQVVEARQLGQYRLRRRIGSGGMGEVYLAEHQLLKRPCA